MRKYLVLKDGDAGRIAEIRLFYGIFDYSHFSKTKCSFIKALDVLISELRFRIQPFMCKDKHFKVIHEDLEFLLDLQTRLNNDLS